MLDTVWTTGEMIGADERMPFAQFLMTPVNRQGVTTLITPGQGKVRNVQVVYMQRLTEDTVNTDQPNPNCGAGEDQGDLSTNYTLDTSVNIQSPGFRLTRDMLENVCQDNGALFNRLFMRDQDVLRRAVATEVSSQGMALTGGWSDYVPTGTTDGTIDAGKYVFQTITGGVYNKMAWMKLYNALTDSGLGTNPFLVGGTMMREYFQLSQNGCCANDGLSIDGLFAQFGYAYAHDVRVQAALGGGVLATGADDFAIVKPGALQLLNYTASPWKDGFPPQIDQSANYWHGVVNDPMMGWNYDVTMEDDCGTVTVNQTWTGKVIGLPNDMFATGDPYEGITGVVLGKVITS